jgi:hypothetical protein
MNEQPTFHSLTEDDLRQRDAFIANRRAKEARSRKLIVGVAFIALLGAIAGGFYAVKSHRTILAANALKMEQENQRAQAQAAQEAAAQAERDFQAAYAGRLESWETILGNRNPIKGWPVRRREAILSDIAAKESEIDGIRSQMRAATTQWQLHLFGLIWSQRLGHGKLLQCRADDTTATTTQSCGRGAIPSANRTATRRLLPGSNRRI